MKRKRLKCRYKVTSTHLYEDMHLMSQLGPDESKCIHQWGYWNITDIRVCSETDDSKRWGKERSRLINPRRHGGRTGVDHASIRNIWLSMTPFVSPHTATWLSFLQNWMNFTKPQIEGILEFKFGFSFSGNKPNLQGREGGEGDGEVYRHCCSWLSLEVVPLKLFHLRLKFHPGNLPVSLCLCFDSLSPPCNLFCLEWGTGMTASVSTQLINNDQIHHSLVWEVTLPLTRWGNLFRCKHE